MLLNIELKGPIDPECFEEYDFGLSARKVVALIDKYQIGHRTLISSFHLNILDAVVEESASSRDFLIQSLRNGFGLEDVLDYATPVEMTGINIDNTYLREERVEKVRSDHRLVGVYVWRSEEDEQMWEDVFSMRHRANFFYSDRALDAMKVRD